MKDSRNMWHIAAGKGLRAALAVAFLLSVAAAPAFADKKSERQESDHERARIAVESGNVVPLALILQRVEALYHGTVIEVELENEEDDGGEHVAGFLYEIKLLTPQGNLLKLELDARTMAVLKVKGRGADAARKPGTGREADE